ncbi:MAG: N-acetyltransferase family protein [Candidatus Bathyarchaeia archaeon]|jgi:GNAT superfamily N-acetyltransferase
MNTEKLNESYIIEISIERYPCLQLTFRVFTTSKHRIDREEVGYAYVEVFGKGSDDLPPKSAYWTDIVIHEKYYRQGIGSKIVKFTIPCLKKYGVQQIFGKISVSDDANRAIAFWRKNGFEIFLYKEPKGNIAEIKFRIV